jgi:hypothetical protein
MFDLESMISFADESHVPKLIRCLIVLISDMEKSFETITKWLKKSGLKVKESKTDLCLSYKGDTAPISVILNGAPIVSASVINVLGILVDSKLQ